MGPPLLYAQRHPYRVTGIVYACETGLEWWPGHSSSHKHNHGMRLGRAKASRLKELRARARTADEQREFERLYLLTEFAAGPVLVVCAVEDPRPIEATDSLVQALPHARRVRLPGCGHFPWLEQHEAFRRLLRSFLVEVTSGSRAG